MQQAIPSRFRDVSHGTIQTMTPPDRRSTVAFSPSDHLDNIFQAVRHQVERWGENAKWKIELILLSDQQQASSYPSATTTTTPPPSSSKQLLPHHPHHHEQDELNHHRSIKPTYYSQGITRSNNRSETWNIPYAADLQHNLRNALDRIKYLENVIRTQEDRLRQLKQPHTLQMMHTTTVNELKEHHQVEMKLLQKENQTLAKKFMRISSTLQKIERIGLSSEESPSDNTTLLEERKLLLRKLHLGELRLRARDAELNYLHNLVWSFRHPSPTTSDDDDDDEEEEDEEQDGQKEQVDKKKKQNVLDKKTSISSSPSSTTIPSPLFLLQKQYSPRPMSALDSLSILADQMLSDPDFGSEGKESSASPDYGPKTHSSLSSTKKNNNSTTMNDYPSSSVYIKKEMNDMTPSALPKKRRRKEPRQQEQVTVASPPLGYYHHGNIKQYRVVGADEYIGSSNNNNNNRVRPSSAFHTIIPFHPHSPSKQNRYNNNNNNGTPVNIIPRPSGTTTKEEAPSSSSKVMNMIVSSPSSSLMSPVPTASSSSSSTMPYHQLHHSHHHQQQQPSSYPTK